MCVQLLTKFFTGEPFIPKFAKKRIEKDLASAMLLSEALYSKGKESWPPSSTYLDSRICCTLSRLTSELLNNCYKEYSGSWGLLLKEIR